MKFVTLLKFTDQGIQNISQTTTREAAFAKQAKDAGLNIFESLWLSGRYDGLIVYDAPDEKTAAAVMLQLSQSGNTKTETLQAFNSADMQKVLEKI